MRLVLPSNSSPKLFPNNTLASYTVQLPYPIDLSKGSWEVALAEIQFNKSWCNVRDASITFIVDERKTTIDIDDGYYSTNEELIKLINDHIKCSSFRRLTNFFQFHYNNITRRTALRITLPRTVQKFDITFSKGLKEILNLHYNFQDLKPYRPSCPNDPPIDRGQIAYELRASDTIKLNAIYNLMVYCDLAETTIVGDVEAPLLRAIPVQDEHWKYQCSSFNNQQFIPISKREVRTISIYIFTDFGELVPFTTGRTIVTLELRKVKSIHLY